MTPDRIEYDKAHRSLTNFIEFADELDMDAAQLLLKVLEQYGATLSTVEEDWGTYWKPFPELKPLPFEIVVVLQNTGRISLDWLEPFGVNKDLMFSEEHGVPERWMRRDMFEAVAPKWVQAEVAPLTKEALTEHGRRSRPSPRVAEAVPEFYLGDIKRRHRCPHGVSELNHCTKCD